METPYKLFVLVSVYLVYDGLYPVSAQTGPNVCYRQETYYTRAKVCAYRTWQSCCYYKYVTKCNFRTISYCCSGYTDVDGRCEPVCFGMTGRQGCSNVGNCVGPDTCSCDSGYRGPQCNNKIACSETKPCYPGNCPSVDNCQCSEGFGSPNCTTILASPIITLASAVLAYNHPMKRMDIYNYTTDATTESGNATGDSASIWANFGQFNKIRGTVSAAFGMESKLSALPSYVTSSKIGVAVATMEWQLEKLIDNVLTRQGGDSSTCSEVSTNNPGNILQECQIEFSYVLAIDSGDVFKLTFQVENGGFEYLRGNIRLPFRQQSSTASKSSVTYRIDLDKPTVNTNTAFIVDEPFTRTKIVTRWSGWTDPLAGMESYNWEIFELQNKSGTQRYAKRSKVDCINPQLGPECNQFLDPIFSQKFNHIGGELSMPYTPTNPGVFAMILEASDRANNSDYVSRYVVYDPSSTIEIQTGDDDIKALSGSKNASFKWQVLYSSSQSGLNLEFSWRGHFINRLHHEGGFLNDIEDYSPQLQDVNTGDNKFPKTVNVKYNVVGENGLTGRLIPNELGITKFQTYLDETGQQNVDINAGVSWVDQNIKTTASFPLAKTVSEGDFVTLWVKAEDKIGNVKLSSLPLGFDSSKPSIYNPSFMQDMGTKYIYGSKLWFKTADEHSGISQISFNIINKSNNTIAANGSVPVNTSNVERGFPDERYRVRDTFYFYQHELEINNCWFRVPKSRQATDRFEVEIIAYNGAMLQSRQAIDVNLNSFKGIGQYQAVEDVNLLRNTGNSVRFSFNLTKSCYRRQKIILNYNDGQDHEKLINPSADKYDLLGLQPLTAYNVSVVVEYDEGDISDPFYYSFRTVAVTTDTGIDTRALGSSQNELSIIKLAFALTVPGMFILCLGVNFLCYKWGVKKGRSSYKKQAKSPGETQALDYHLYDDETPLSQLRSGPSGGPAGDPATHDYAAYDEIKEQRQRIAAGSERKKDGGYITPMAQDRPLPPVGGGDGNGYISPKTAQKQPQKGNAGKNGDSPSPPGNGGYLSPLEERKLSSNSDSGSDKSDKSRKYQNEPGKKSPKSKGVYESIKDAGITQEHQYIDLHTTVS